MLSGFIVTEESHINLTTATYICKSFPRGGNLKHVTSLC